MIHALERFEDGLARHVNRARLGFAVNCPDNAGSAGEIEWRVQVNIAFGVDRAPVQAPCQVAGESPSLLKAPPGTMRYPKNQVVESTSA